MTKDMKNNVDIALHALLSLTLVLVIPYALNFFFGADFVVTMIICAVVNLLVWYWREALQHRQRYNLPGNQSFDPNNWSAQKKHEGFTGPLIGTGLALALGGWFF